MFDDVERLKLLQQFEKPIDLSHGKEIRLAHLRSEAIISLGGSLMDLVSVKPVFEENADSSKVTGYTLDSLETTRTPSTAQQHTGAMPAIQKGSDANLEQYASKQITLASGQTIYLGRTKTAWMNFSAEVSRSHAMIDTDETTITIRDDHSTNGTLLFAHKPDLDKVL